MGPNRAFEAVEQEEDGRILGSVEMMEIQEIAIRSLQPLDSCIVYLRTAKEFSP